MKPKIATIITAAICCLAIASGCAGGPDRITAIEGVQLPSESDGAVGVVVEYKGSESGAPIPGWVGKQASDLEALPQYGDYYLFVSSGIVDSYDTAIARIREYWASEETRAQIVSRVLAKCSGVEPLPGDLLKDTIQLIEVTEYVGLMRQDDFWVCECTNFEEKKEAANLRYRYWILSSIPKSQVNAGLRFAYESVAPRYPSQTQAESAAIDLLIDRFRDGL